MIPGFLGCETAFNGPIVPISGLPQASDGAEPAAVSLRDANDSRPRSKSDVSLGADSALGVPGACKYLSPLGVVVRSGSGANGTPLVASDSHVQLTPTPPRKLSPEPHLALAGSASKNGRSPPNRSLAARLRVAGTSRRVSP